MNQKRHAQLAQALDRILDILITQYQPDKIILFGSTVTGNVGEWSDLDLVIIKETPKPFIQRLKEVALLCLVPVSVDYLVYTPDEFEKMIAEGNYFIVNEVLKKGKVLYEREPARQWLNRAREDLAARMKPYSLPATSSVLSKLTCRS